MGDFSDGNEEDELFDLFMLNEIHKGSSKNRKPNGSVGCLTSLLLILTVPIGIVIGVIALCV